MKRLFYIAHCTAGGWSNYYPTAYAPAAPHLYGVVIYAIAGLTTECEATAKFGWIAAVILVCLSSDVAAAPMKEMRIQALRSGAIVFDRVFATFEMLNAKLAQIKAASGVVLFYREEPGLSPTEQVNISKARLSLAWTSITFRKKSEPLAFVFQCSSTAALTDNRCDHFVNN